MELGWRVGLDRRAVGVNQNVQKDAGPARRRFDDARDARRCSSLSILAFPRDRGLQQHARP
jgi:hypothetical protein